MIHKTEPASPNFRTELARQLNELVPEAIADGKVDVDKLKELLSDDVADSSERFGLFWPGKKRALRAAQEPTTATLRPDFANSKDWDTTKNVFIEGDNLEVLKILQKHYHNKIKMIYIDPPYNTGKDFVYPDNYKEGLETYLEFTKQVTEGGRRVSTNSETEGRYHSNWLNMMYPRLKLARNLLTDDGVIFISIDDNEVDNLLKLCNEIFGDQNRIATVIWKRKRGKDNSAKNFSRNHEFMLVYSRKESSVELRKLAMGEETRKAYTNPENDPRGPYRTIAAWATGQKSGSVYSPVLGTTNIPLRKWVYSESTLMQFWGEGRLVLRGMNSDGAPNVYRKVYLSESRGQLPDTIWVDTSNAADGADEVKGLFDGNIVFSTVKPIAYIKRIVQLCTHKKGSIALDFFAGSGTTADAILQMNAEDGGNRQFIMVQLNEPVMEMTEAAKAGYSTISELSRERIRRAGEKVLSDNALISGARETPLDVGFRAYKLADSNFSKWQLSSNVKPDSLEQNLLEMRGSSSADEATPEDLLTEVLLKQGYSLTEKIEAENIGGLDVRSIGHGLVLAYLDEHHKPTLEQLRALVAEDPARLIVLEDAFQGDDELKTNIAQLCTSKNIEFWTA
jgi:adenine-specific DNA-methyltransferase